MPTAAKAVAKRAATSSSSCSGVAVHEPSPLAGQRGTYLPAPYSLCGTGDQLVDEQPLVAAEIAQVFAQHLQPSLAESAAFGGLADIGGYIIHQRFQARLVLDEEQHS